MAGYSGTPLTAKLGIKPGMTMKVVHAPKEFRELLAPLPDGARIASALGSYRRQLDGDTPVWVSWPKKFAGVATDITEDTIRTLALPLGFVDIKVVRRDRR